MKTLRFTKSGKYECDQKEIAEGTAMIVFIPSLKRGWVKWKDGVPVLQVMGYVTNNYKPPKRKKLGNLKTKKWDTLDGVPIDPWQETCTLLMADHDGQVYTFTTSSKPGMSAIGELCSAYVKRIRLKPNDLPEIELYSRMFQHKDYGTIFAPSFKIISWLRCIQFSDEHQGAIAI